jgi:MarR family 2-MHQ and catechol resistance regulon transcriptional repressor
MLKNIKNTNQTKLTELLMLKEVQSWIAIMDSFKVVYSKLEMTLNDEGISISRFQVMFFLYFEGNASANSLSKKLLVTRGNMSMLLKRMELDGLVSYISIDGKKRQLIKLTNIGINVFEDIFPRHIERVRALVAPLSKATLNELSKLKINAENKSY